jgi:3-methyladenine DNA glycosylase AlkC
MNGLTRQGDRRMTVREVAKIAGAAYSTVAAYAQKAGWTENGKQTFLDENQVAIIVEAMKNAQHNQTRDTFQASLEGIETTQSRAVRIAILAQKQQEIDRQIKIEFIRKVLKSGGAARATPASWAACPMQILSVPL